ncbi:TRAP-type C4-dicarboxylate transport system, periplasmic component [Pacificimonas flava]|uniref:TRAP-type C4-dicarboxylate transport system, periplasmic component n=2 Tax=Pacificimonas flava TaxID=1234595 RepID=M2U910_9SPHN|nr:TRAP-type C4-dicarboxylate transport system, periplasmic component [Pacificimonas flava]
MGRRLEGYSNGRMRLKLYPGGQLGSERDTLELATFGGIDLNRVALAPLNSIEPLTIVPSLPFLFDDEAHMRRAMDGAPGEDVLKSLAPHGLIGLCFYDSGARSIYNVSGPVRRPEDLNGLKVRVQSSDLYVSLIEALGANATPMPLGEIYQALVQGVIDGAENNWPSFESTRHYEVARYYSLTRHVIAPEVLVMSRTVWENLSSSDRDIILKSARESVSVMRGLWDEKVDQSRQTLAQSGVQVNEIDDIGAFVERVQPVWKRFVTSPAQRALVDAIRAMSTAA